MIIVCMILIGKVSSNRLWSIWVESCSIFLTVSNIFVQYSCLFYIPVELMHKVLQNEGGGGGGGGGFVCKWTATVKAGC